MRQQANRASTCSLHRRQSETCGCMGVASRVSAAWCATVSMHRIKTYIAHTVYSKNIVANGVPRPLRSRLNSALP